jgi:hypothetical protein
MSTSAQPQESVNPKSGMAQTEAKEFVRNHFEEFVNRKNLDTGNVNFAPEFADHGADVPPGTPPGPVGAIQYVGLQEISRYSRGYPRSDGRGWQVVVRNRSTGTEAASGKKFEFSGIVIWRIAHRQLVERWA